MKQLFVLFVSALSLIACASVDKMTGNEPIVDTRGVDLEVYEEDMAACQAYADQVQVAAKTASSAGAGAVFGAVVGAAAGNGNTARRGAGVGAASGTLSGVSSSIEERQRVMKNCLAGRGYRVLN